MRPITFDETTRDLVLAVFDKAVDSDGYIIDISSGSRVPGPDGNDVHIDNFAGFRKGSEIIIRKDLPSLLEYAGDIRG